jgi:hypothetical protein
VEYVQLDRRFVSLAESREIDPEVWAAIRGADGHLSWDYLLQRKRVVILAEAGSGKSTELEQRYRAWKAAGHAAFHGRLQTVGRRGLMAIMSPAEKSAFEAWKNTDQPAWFFLDSVDEAKLDNTRLEDVLAATAEVLGPYLGRAHIVLTGRHTDWEFRRDLERLGDILPVPVEHMLEELADHERLEDVIHNRSRSRKGKDQPKPEAPVVVVLAGLDERQIRLFAAAAGVTDTDLDAFVAALERSDLMDFAKRPLDLEWLALSWKRDGAFAAFARMLDQALLERSKEVDPLRAQQAPLDAGRVRDALRRIGAALVLARKQSIAIPDTALGAPALDDAIDLRTVLPDWPAPDIQRLARLPAFDPGAPGMARLHNDNKGEVRGFLAAEWMRELRAKNCPVRAIFDLLFADTYGLTFVRPSMRETAAWLSLWDRDVAAEVLKRDPHVLLDFGDPGSLPLATREEALRLFVASLADGGERIQHDHDALRRFAKPDLSDAIRAAWSAHASNPEVKGFLLQLIWLGQISACSDLAVAAVYEPGAKRWPLMVGGRALLAVGSEEEKRRYGAHVALNAKTLPLASVWDAVDALFPALLPVSDFIAILDGVDFASTDSIYRLETEGAAWGARLSDPAEIENIIAALDRKIERSYGDPDRADETGERHVLPMMVAAAQGLLKIVPDTEAPAAAVDALLRAAAADGFDDDRSARALLQQSLQQTSERRRVAFWRAAFRFSHAKYLSDGLNTIWKLQHLGYDPGLKEADLDWLLADAVRRPDASERALAIDAAMWVWRSLEKPPAVLQRVRDAVGNDPDLNEVIGNWTVARLPDPKYVEMENRHEKMKRDNEKRRAEVTKSWKEFVDDLRANPDQLRSLRAVTGDTIDRRLYDIWQLLNSADQGRTRYAIETTDALEPIMGRAAADAAADALIAFWREWKPGVRSAREADKKTLSFAFDNMGIAGVAMEAKRKSDWPTGLSKDDASRAAQFATLELNGFPAYLTPLAERFPNEVREALITEIKSELDDAAERGSTLESVPYAGGPIAALLAEPLEQELRARDIVTRRHLHALLRAMAPVVAPERRDGVTALLLERFKRAGASRDEQIEYLGAAFELDPVKAAAAMLAEAGQMQQPERSEFLQQTMAVYFGRTHSYDGRLAEAPFEMLEELVRAAYGAIDPTHDAQHKGAYTPDLRDDAESARSHLVEKLVKTPGRATYETLLRLNDDPEFKSRPGRFRELAIGRAAEDSEHAPWDGAAIERFETEFDDTPRTGADLLLLARRRLEDIEHDLRQGDFAQGKTLREIQGGERAVQNFIADRLRAKQARAYSVEREVHVVDEKEPDIRLRAAATDASVPIEVKDLESDWSLADLETALRDQLCGQYLRDRNHRHGVLLLVQRRTRPLGWRNAGGVMWRLEDVVSHLRNIAAAISAGGSDAPVAEVIVVDVAP